MAKSIGRYEIREELGRGGMAAVYLAFDLKLDRQVALKLMDQQLSADPSFAARFEREAKTVASLDHSAIVPLHDYGEADGWLFLVMRYMKGGSLKELIAKGPLTQRGAYDVVRRIGGALDKAHSMGIVHRDLKPANILLDDEQEAYLSDFGIVKVAQGDTEFLTETGQTLGTFAYMSPEQVMGKALDGRSDLYTLGIVLYEMLTGRHPFGEATTSGAMAVAHAQQAVPNIRDDNPAVSAAVNDVVQKTLAKDPNDRYATGREMTLALYEALTGKPAAATGAASAGVAAAAAAQKTAAQKPAKEKPATPPPAPEPAAQKPAAQEPAVPPVQQPAQPATRQPAAPTSTAQPASEPAAKQKRKTPVWIFAVIGVVVIVCIAIAAVAGLSVFGGSDDENGNRSIDEVAPLTENETNQNEPGTTAAGDSSNQNEPSTAAGDTATTAGENQDTDVEALEDGQLATGGEDGTARLWDVAAGQEMAVLSGHESAVFSVAYRPDEGR
jgi:serine/threonine-protein kinase